LADHRGKIDSIYPEVGRRIREARNANTHQLTQQGLGDQIGLSRESIANIERGRQQVLLHHVLQIATVLGVPITDLVPHNSIEKLSLDDALENVSDDERSFVARALKDN